MQGCRQVASNQQGLSQTLLEASFFLPACLFLLFPLISMGNALELPQSETDFGS